MARLSILIPPSTSQFHIVRHNYGFAGSIDERLNRVQAIKDNVSNLLVEYLYNGTSRMVRADYPQIDLRLTYEHADDDGVYERFDRFGRVIDQRWLVMGVTDWDRFEYAEETETIKAGSPGGCRRGHTVI